MMMMMMMMMMMQCYIYLFNIKSYVKCTQKRKSWVKIGRVQRNKTRLDKMPKRSDKMTISFMQTLKFHRYNLQTAPHT